MSNVLNFYRTLLIRQFRQTSIRLFCIAITIACAVTFSISLLGDRLEQLFHNQAKEVLAADVVLQSSTELNDQQETLIQSMPLSRAKTLTFQTMAHSQVTGKFLLSSVKAVSDQYPLIGELEVSEKLYGTSYATAETPQNGEAWVEDRVLNELGINLNQYINIGEASFKVTRVLIYEPDKGNSFYSFTPRVLIGWQGVAATKVIQPGSRVTYRYLFAGEPQKLSELQQQLSDSLQRNQQFLNVDSANQTLAETLKRAYRFLNVTALIAVLLGAIAAALVSFQYANDMTFQYALLRCLGLKSRQMMAAIIFPFIIYSLTAIFAGYIIGALAHWLMLSLLGDLIPEKLPSASLKPFMLSALTAMIVVASFAWPFIHRLLNTAPGLLLNDSQISQQPRLISALFMIAGLSFLIYTGTTDVVISVYIVVSLLAFILFVSLLANYCIGLFDRFTDNNQASLKLAARSLKANRYMVTIQIIAVALTFFSLALIGTVRDDLITSWQAKVPPDAPNIFAINLFEKDSDLFIDSLKDRNIIHSPLYPITRGRLSAVNDININQYANEASNRYDESLERDLALTWSETLPQDNRIIKGNWHSGNQQVNEVSIEQGIAENLDIDIGDDLTFTVSGQKITAMVTSLRTVEWESFTPNFYMIFSPGSLDELPATYMISLRLDSHQRPVLRDLVDLFPSVTFFDVDFLLNKVRQIASNVSYAVETVMVFSLFSSIMVFISIELILRRYRAYSTAIFRAVGADSFLLKKIFRAEYVFIGLIAGVMAYLLTMSVSAVLTNYVIDGNFVFNLKTAILCLLIAPGLVVLGGYISIHTTRNTPVQKLIAGN